MDDAFVMNFRAQNQPVRMARAFELIMAITARVAHGQLPQATRRSALSDSGLADADAGG
jgi:hypothetical protein